MSCAFCCVGEWVKVQRLFSVSPIKQALWFAATAKFMYRIFSSLALFALGLLITALVIGLIGPDFNGLSETFRNHVDAASGQLPDAEPLSDAELFELRTELEAAKRHVRLHILTGILAAIVTVLVQSVGVTYFIGTGRWCKEVVETYELDADWTRRSNRIKRRAFPWAMLGIGLVLAISAFGAAADPGTLAESPQHYVQPHHWLAWIGTAMIAICLRGQASAIRKNQEVILAILAEVKQMREDRGLEVEAV